MPLVVTRFDASSRTVQAVRDLKVDDLTIRVGTAVAVIVAVSVEKGPKRVALVLDASRQISKDEWTLEVGMAQTLVAHARPGDSLALLLIGATSVDKTVSRPSEIYARLHALGHSRPAGSEAGERTIDTLIDATKLLTPHLFGDTIFLFGHDHDSGSQANLDQLRSALLKDRTRFYALSFRNPLVGKLPSGTDLNAPLPANLGPSDLVRVSVATGYNFSFHSVQDLEDPGQVQLLKKYIGDIYLGIAEPYRVVIAADSIPAPASVQLEIARADARHIIARDIHYPRFIYPCGSDIP
jgi:hypothetical protein